MAEILERTNVLQMALVEISHLVGVADSRQPVSDHDDGLLRLELAQGGDDLALGDIVECAGRLIQDQHVRIVVQGPGYADALFLPAAEHGSALANDERILSRQDPR